jgi:rfaE bifunctional protein nucleotidyltransferase chain/domain
MFAAEARKRGKRIVTTNGAFDLLHPGHRFLLEEAKAQGDVLIVGVNSDASVRGSKGPGRPVELQDIRARKVAAYADAVFVFDDPDPRSWLPSIRPDVHVNAETYGRDCIEAPVLREIGATLVLVPVRKELGSTSEILRTRQA